MASLWKVGTFILMKMNIDRHLDSLVREYSAICMGLYCLLLLEKPPNLKVKMSKKVTSFKLMIVSWNKLKSLFAHLKQINNNNNVFLGFYLIKSQWFISNLSNGDMSSLLETYNSVWTYRATCNWSLYQDLLFLMVE